MFLLILPIAAISLLANGSGAQASDWTNATVVVSPLTDQVAFVDGNQSAWFVLPGTWDSAVNASVVSGATVVISVFAANASGGPSALEARATSGNGQTARVHYPLMNDTARYVEISAAPGDPEALNGTNVTFSLAREILPVLQDEIPYVGDVWISTNGDHDAPILIVNSSSRGLSDSLLTATVELTSQGSAAPAELLTYMLCSGPPLCGRPDFPPGYVRQLGYFPSWRSVAWVNLSSQAGVGSVSALAYQDSGQGAVLLTFGLSVGGLSNQSLAFSVNITRSALVNGSADDSVATAAMVDSHAPLNGSLAYGLDTVDWFQVTAPGGSWRIDASFDGRKVAGGLLQMSAELMLWNSAGAPLSAVNSQTTGVSCGGCIAGRTMMSLPVSGAILQGEALYVSLFVLQNDLLQPAPWTVNGSLSYSLLFHLPNQPPQRLQDALDFSINEDENVTLDLGAYYSDGDGDDLAYQVTLEGSAMALDIALSGAFLTLTPGTDENGVANLTVVVSDGYAGWAEPIALTLTVRAVNDPPRVNASQVPALIEWDQRNRSGDVLVGQFVYDVDGDKLTFSLSSPSELVMTACAPSCVQFAGASSEVNGSFEAVVRAFDPSGENISFTLNIYIHYVNRPPVANVVAPTTVVVVASQGGRTLFVAEFCSDPDADNLTLSYDPASPAGSTITASPAPNASGSSDLMITVPSPDDVGELQANLVCTDEGGLAVGLLLSVTSIAPNGPPAVMSVFPDPAGEVVLDENMTVEFGVSAADPDGDPLAYTWSLAGVELLGQETNRTTLWFDFESAGLARVELAIEDQAGHTIRVNWSLTVNNVDRPPVCVVAAPGGLNGTVGSELTLGSTSVDPDGTPVTHEWYVNGTLVSQAATVSLEIRPGQQVVDLHASSDGTTRVCSVRVTSEPPLPGNDGQGPDQDDRGFLTGVGALLVVAAIVGAVGVSIWRRGKQR